MKVLLTGILPDAAWEMAARLVKDGHQAALLGEIPQPRGKRPPGVAAHAMHPGHPDALRMVEAARYQAIVFFYAHQCEDTRDYGSVQGAMLDALFALLHEAGVRGVEKFVLVTDRRVFARGQAGREDEVPVPDTPTGVLIKAAEDCLICGAPEGLGTLLLRVTSLYAQGDGDSLFAQMAACAREGRQLVLPGGPQTPCDFLHAEDAAMFLGMALDKGLTGVVHLAYEAKRTYRDVEKWARSFLPGLEIAYDGGPGRGAILATGEARALHWVPRHDCAREMEGLLAEKAGVKVKTKGGRPRLGRLTGKAVPWVELALLGALAGALTRSSEAGGIFRLVDYWLLYVAVMGNMHGAWLGLAAAAVACLDYAASWAVGGGEMYLLLYNMDNWLPLSCYLLAGSLFGYLHDKQKQRIDELEQEKAEQDAEAEFLQSLYHQAHEDRNRLKEQVMRYRDSYGRIYQITRELDTLQPEQVFLSTLGVMEDTMQNQTVAIYSRKEGTPFARLVVHSRGMTDMARSLDMEKYPSMLQRLNEGKMFANTALEPGYPAYAAPIMLDGAPVATVMLWTVPFDKRTLYYENLLSIVAGLVQSAMVRALKYFNMSGDVYLKDTHILCDQAFRSALGVYENMRKRRFSQYLLVRVQGEKGLSGQEYDKRIGRAIRSTDLAGQMSDGSYYVLFPQATVENLPQIAARFAGQGIGCQVVAQEAAHA